MFCFAGWRMRRRLSIWWKTCKTRKESGLWIGWLFITVPSTRHRILRIGQSHRSTSRQYKCQIGYRKGFYAFLCEREVWPSVGEDYSLSLVLCTLVLYITKELWSAARRPSLEIRRRRSRIGTHVDRAVYLRRWGNGGLQILEPIENQFWLLAVFASQLVKQGDVEILLQMIKMERVVLSVGEETIWHVVEQFSVSRTEWNAPHHDDVIWLRLSWWMLLFV